MPQTPNRNWTYPAKGDNPYYDMIVVLYNAIDADVQAAYDLSFHNIGSGESTGSISASSYASGSVSMSSFNQGVMALIQGTQTSGSSTAVVIEFYDGDPDGSGNLLYQSNSWDASAGDHDDRNAFGFLGLTSGTIWWKVTNNGVSSVTINLTWACTGIN